MRSPESPSTTRRSPITEATPSETIVRIGGEADPGLIGGKAAGLAALARAGFDVPNSFVVTSNAYAAAIDRLVATVSTLRELREALLEITLPESLLDELRLHLDELGPGPWAVRSSGLAEDGEHHSFAGQNLTVLHVDSLTAVTEAIRRIWSETLSEDVLLYRSRVSVDAIPAGVAVLVQPMLRPDVAGVCFTREPTTLDPEVAVVCSARGLGTSVVGGEACDTYFIERPSGYIQRKQTHEGTLNRADLVEFAMASEQAERAFGRAMDLEWAKSDGRIVFLQARPITTPAAREESVWSNANVGEALPGVGTPLTWSIIRRFSRRGFERAFGTLGLDVPDHYDVVGSFSGRVYLNLTQFADITSQIPLLSPDALFEMAGGGGVELVRHQYEQREVGLFVARLPRTIPRILATQMSMPVIAPAWNKLFQTWTHGFFAKSLDALDRSALGDELDRLDKMFDANGEVMLAAASNFLMSYALTREVLRALGHTKVHGREQELLRGLHVPSSEPGLALLELGRIARRSRRLRRLIGETPPEETLSALEQDSDHEDVSLFLQVLGEFRREFGHRAPREAELSTPRWREESSFLFDVIRGYIAAPHLPTARELDRDREEAEAEVRRIVARAFAIPGVGVSFMALLAFVRGNAKRREMLRSRVVDSLDMYRRYFLECGRRLRDEGALADPDDVFFLTVAEVRDWLREPSTAREFRYRVLVRRAMHEKFSEAPDPPNIFVLRGSEIIDEDTFLHREELDRKPTDGLTEIRGLAASSGRVTARARVMHSAADAAFLAPGEVLIAPFADIGWTPMFLTASAVVMDLGGPLSHAAIVAREYGLPAVVNARGVMDKIRTGDLVTVDGDRGTVFIRERADCSETG